MFLTSLSTSPLVGTAADEIFCNITGDTYRGDVSFLSTMRMLLHPRLPEGIKATLKFAQVGYEAVKGISVKEDAAIFKALTGVESDIPENQVWFVDVQCANKDDTEKAYKNFGKIKNIVGMQSDAPVDSMFSQFCSARTFIDFDHCRTLIVVFDRATSAKWHAAASLTSRFFRKYFLDKPITDWEKENIAMALTNEDKPDKFNAAMYEFSKQFDFRSPMIRASLKGFENRNLKQRIENAQEEIRSLNTQIDDLNRKYAAKVRHKNSLEEQCIAFQLNIKEEKNELMEYFLHNKNLYLAESSGDRITFYVRTPFANFNPDLAEKIISNPEREERVEMYRCGSSAVKTEDRDLLFKSIMLDRKIRVWLYGKFTMYVTGDSCIQTYSEFESPVEMHDTCPNPHLYRHACMGQNQRAAIDAVLAGDYVTAVEQCIGSVASVNLAETVTSGPWMDNLLSDRYGRFFETKDGRFMNFTEVMKYLKEEK